MKGFSLFILHLPPVMFVDYIFKRSAFCYSNTYMSKWVISAEKYVSQPAEISKGKIKIPLFLNLKNAMSYACHHEVDLRGCGAYFSRLFSADIQCLTVGRMKLESLFFILRAATFRFEKCVP